MPRRENTSDCNLTSNEQSVLETRSACDDDQIEEKSGDHHANERPAKSRAKNRGLMREASFACTCTCAWAFAWAFACAHDAHAHDAHAHAHAMHIMMPTCT
eukprot:3951427-Prymnesium_polylepis.1